MTTLADTPSPARERSTLGGLVPVGAIARAGSTAVCCPALEVHADGAVLPLVVLSDNAGPVGLDVPAGVGVSDDLGTAYGCSEAAATPGLGLLHVDVWVEPAPPPGARSLRVSVEGLVRTAITRRGEGVPRLLSDGPWEIEIPLRPGTTRTPPPPEPSRPARARRRARVPLRALPALRDLVPIGQACIDDRHGVCLWALERYSDRGVLTLVVLAPAGGHDPGAGPAEAGAVRMWDDRGRCYSVLPVHTQVRAGWSETTFETAPAVGDDVSALGIAVAGIPGPGGGEGPERRFGVRMPPA